jgi:hypothetical protein
MPAILPLANGDRLSRDEFERRYEAMPNVRAELIEGVVYMSSPVSTQFHGEPHGDLMAWASVYKAATRGVRSADNATVKLDWTNEPQPDVFLMVRPEFGGAATVDAGGYVNGAPEFVAEVAASSVSIDLGDKMGAYRRNRVREYLVWRVYDRAIDWFVLRTGQYVALTPDADGLFKSEVFPGLWLDSSALLTGDLATAEHAAFVAQLAARQTP